MKPKHKTKRDLFRVDFVTAYTVEECRDHLVNSGEAQTALVSDTGGFTVERDVEWGFPPRYGTAFNILFRGQLTPTDYGTHVQGEITRETFTRLNVSKWIMWIFTAFTLLFLVVVVEEPLDPMCITWLVFVLIAGVLFSYWYVAYTRTIALIDWIHDQLHVLPADDSPLTPSP
jgi:hypothetical protein